MPHLPEEKHTLELIARFTAFLEDFGNSTDSQQEAFLNFLAPSSRSDLADFAKALRKTAKKEKKRNG